MKVTARNKTILGTQKGYSFDKMGDSFLIYEIDKILRSKNFIDSKTPVSSLEKENKKVLEMNDLEKALHTIIATTDDPDLECLVEAQLFYEVKKRNPDISIKDIESREGFTLILSLKKEENAA